MFDPKEIEIEYHQDIRSKTFELRDNARQTHIPDLDEYDAGIEDLRAYLRDIENGRFHDWDW